MSAARGSVPHMELHPGEEMVFDGHPSWRAVLSFYITGVIIVAVIVAVAALASGAALAIVLGAVALAVMVSSGWSSGRRRDT